MKKIALETWIRRGLVDYYVTFQLSRLTTYWSFPLQQAIEKLCKAYLIALRASEWTNLESNYAARWIEEFVRSKELRHGLWQLVTKVSEDLPSLKVYVQGKRENSFLDLLTLAYEEARYPKPIDDSIWSKHGFEAWFNDQNERQGFEIGAHILVGLRDKHGISVPMEGPLPDSGIPVGEWERFLNIWNLRVGHIYPMIGPTLMVAALHRK